MPIDDRDEKILSDLMSLFDRHSLEDGPNLPIVDASDRLDEALVRKMEDLIDEAISSCVSDCLLRIFEDNSLLMSLIVSSGGNNETLFTMLHDSFQFSETLPVSRRAIGKARGNLRCTMSNSIDSNKWCLLARVHIDPHGDYDVLPEYQALPKWSILKYEDGDRKWYRLHPLLVEATAFRKAVEAITK